MSENLFNLSIAFLLMLPVIIVSAGYVIRDIKESSGDNDENN